MSKLIRLDHKFLPSSPEKTCAITEIFNYIESSQNRCFIVHIFRPYSLTSPTQKPICSFWYYSPSQVAWCTPAMALTSGYHKQSWGRTKSIFNFFLEAFDAAYIVLAWHNVPSAPRANTFNHMTKSFKYQDNQLTSAKLPDPWPRAPSFRDMSNGFYY